MEDSNTSVLARIEWCRRQRTQARTAPELEEWRAEEEGLLDAFLKRDHTNHYRYSSPSVFERYAMGLEDGQALIRLAWVDRHLATSRR
jgi:hypothetical protein